MNSQTKPYEMKKEAKPYATSKIKEAVKNLSEAEFPFIIKLNGEKSVNAKGDLTNSGFNKIKYHVKKYCIGQPLSVLAALKKIEFDLSQIYFIKPPKEGDLVKVYFGDNEYAFGKVINVSMSDHYEFDEADDFEFVEARELKKKAIRSRQVVNLFPCKELMIPIVNFYLRNARCRWIKMPILFTNIDSGNNKYN